MKKLKEQMKGEGKKDEEEMEREGEEKKKA